MIIQDFGRIPAGDAHLYTLTNAAGTALTVTDVGASVVSLVYRGVDVALGYDGVEDYAHNNGTYGSTIGRNANRIENARFAMDGREYVLAKNDGENNLHSGPDGYDGRLWQTAEITDSSITFFLDSPDGDQGFPGRLRLYAAYELTENDEIRLTYRGECDAATVCNITNHTYFNLNGHDSGSVRGHVLRLYADEYTPGKPGLIPTGAVESVEGTPFDFRQAHSIGQDLDADYPQLVFGRGYDQNFVLRGIGFRPAAELTGDKSGITLRVSTDRPGLQVYSGNFIGHRQGKNGAQYRDRDAVCLETQCFPNAVNQPGFPTSVLRPGETWRTETVWAFSRRD